MITNRVHRRSINQTFYAVFSSTFIDVVRTANIAVKDGFEISFQRSATKMHNGVNVSGQFHNRAAIAELADDCFFMWQNAVHRHPVRDAHMRGKMCYAFTQFRSKATRCTGDQDAIIVSHTGVSLTKSLHSKFVLQR